MAAFINNLSASSYLAPIDTVMSQHADVLGGDLRRLAVSITSRTDGKSMISSSTANKAFATVEEELLDTLTGGPRFGNA